MTGIAGDGDEPWPYADLREAARAAYVLAGDDRLAAVALADRVVAAVPRQGASTEQREGESLAHRAAALALVDVPDLPAAERRARRAVAVATRAGLDAVASEATMTLAWVLLERGRGTRALEALDALTPQPDVLVAARLSVQRALVLQRGFGRTAEALALYDEALPVLEQHGDRLWCARALHNRAHLRAYAGDIDLAIDDERAAVTLFEQSGQSTSATLAIADLGWAVGMSGRIPDALRLMDEAAERLGSLDAVAELDRADVLLRAGLSYDAVATAGAAAAWLRDQGLFTAEAELMLARALLRSGDVAAALAHADVARLAFGRQRRHAWRVLAEHVREVARVHHQHGAPTAATLRTVRELELQGWRVHALDLAITAADEARAHGDPTRARALLAAVRARPGELDDVRARTHHARALELLLDDRHREAMVHVSRSWALTERLRDLVGATELQATASGRAADVVALGLESALASGSATRFLTWSERGRAATLRFPPAMPPEDAELAASLARMRFAAHSDDQERLAGTPEPALAAERRKIERDVVRLTRRATASRAPAPPATATAVRERLGGRCLVQYTALRGDLVAVVVDERRTRVVPLGPIGPVDAAVTRLELLLRRTVSGFASPAHASGPVPAAERAATLVLDPLRDLVRDRELVISPTGSLWRLPWAWLPALRGRPTVLTPSATVWCRGTDRVAPREPTVLAVAGPHLAWADAEVDDVARAHARVEVLRADDASTAAVTERLVDADIAHLAVHGSLRVDNPLFSSLALADGPLTAYELERLPRAPRVVVLPACHSGEARGPVADEPLGLAWTLLGCGAATVVATLGAVPDEATVPVMRELHARLANGASVAHSLAAAQAVFLDDEDPLVSATAASFLCLGS